MRPLPRGTADAGARLVVGQVHALHARIQALPGLVVGALVGEQLLDAARFDLHLQFRVARRSSSVRASMPRADSGSRLGE
jgi:hypothetical protein